MDLNLHQHIGEKIIIKNTEYAFGILDDSIGEHPIWDSEKYRIFAGFDDSHIFIDIDDEEGYNVLSEEYDISLNDFQEYKKCVEELCNKLIGELD